MVEAVSRLNHTQKIFSKTNWNVTESILSGKILQLASPILTLDLTDACNFKCEYCIDKSLVSIKKNEEIDWEILKKLLIGLKEKGCRCIEITGGGEPTLYSHFENFLMLSTELGYRLALITNGSNLHNYLSTIIRSSFDWVRVSLNAGTESTHSHIHKTKKNCFNEILKSIYMISSYHNVGVSYLLTDDNINEIYLAAYKSKESHAKYFEIKPLIKNEKSMIFNDINTVDIIKNQIIEAKKLEDNSFKIIFPSSMTNFLLHKDADPKYYRKCLASYYRSVLSPSGIYVCPYHRGNNHSQHIPQSADELIDLRNSEIASITPKDDCKGFCARSEINEVLYQILQMSRSCPNVVHYLGWPVDYGEDYIWL